MGWQNAFSQGNSNSCGTAILVCNYINFTLLSTIPDPLGRFIILKVQVDDKVYVLVNIYAPHKDNDLIRCFRRLYVLLQTENFDPEENIVLGGDFSCPLHVNPTLDKSDGTMIPRKTAVDSIECLQSN